MNNWHLLLLAIAAVFKPIASFTERNLVDGRQQCCDRQTDIGLRDGRSSLYGTDRLYQAPTLIRHLKDWDKTQTDQRDTVITRRSKERSLLDNRERDSIRISSNLVRLTRVENRPDRLSAYVNGERRLDVERRNRYTRSIDDVNSESQSVTRARDSVMHYDDRTTELQARNPVFRNDVRVSRFSNERFARDFDSTGGFRHTLRSLTPRRDTTDSSRRFKETPNTSDNLRRAMPARRAREGLTNLASTRATQNNLRQTREESVEISNGNRQEFVRQRTNAVKRETLSRGEVRRYTNNNDKRERERNSERRALSENSRGDRIHIMDLRANSRDEIRNNRDDVSTDQRFMREISPERRQLMVESRGHIRQSSDRRLSRKNDNDERRERERYAEQRKAVSESSRVGEQINNMRSRDDSRNAIRENRDRDSTNQRFTTKTSEERRLVESRRHIRESTDRRLSPENNNDERRERERYANQRRALSENSRNEERIHNMLFRDNFRNKNRENRDRVSTDQRFRREGSEERRQKLDDSREHNIRQTIDRRFSRENINDERRERERYTEQRLAVSEISRVDEHIHNMRLRDNSRDENRENRDRINNNDRLMREMSEDRRQLMVESREYMRRSTERSISRKNNNDDRRELERNTEQRRALSESSRFDERIRNKRSRVNSREEIRGNSDRVSTNQQFLGERTVDRSRDHTRQNSDRRLSRERIEMAVRATRVSKTMDNVNIRLDRAVENRQDIRYNERQNRDTRDNEVLRERRFTSRESRKMPSIEQNTLASDRRARSLDLRNFRDFRVEPKLSQVAEMVRERDVSRKQVEYRNNKDMKERDNTHIDSRIRNMIDNKAEDVTDTATSNWHYILYTLQSAYLCGLFMQMMLPNRSEKSKIMHLRWWSKTPIKVD